VAVLILFSLVGVLFPQQGQVSRNDMLQWQQQHPAMTSLLKPVGFFAVFHSLPFMVTIGVLAVNTLTCTLIHFAEKGGFKALMGSGAMITWGFLLLHLAFVLLLAGGFISAATRMDGYILLTEGQNFTDRPQNYLRYSTGSLRPSISRDFDVQLKEVNVIFEEPGYIVDMNTALQFQSQQNQLTEATIRINQPIDYEGMTFTLDETGYSPRIIVRDKQNSLVNSFVALQTLTSMAGRQYRDYLPLPFFENRVTVQLYPAGQVDSQTGTASAEPVIFIKTADAEGNTLTRSPLPLNQTTTADGYEFEFAELRQWASFRVSSDPGYPVVWAALWLGLAALVLRYLPELSQWNKADGRAGS
jgi:cytochrome c biogenesis protein ResB